MFHVKPQTTDDNGALRVRAFVGRRAGPDFLSNLTMSKTLPHECSDARAARG